jgi:hypothetical protein
MPSTPAATSQYVFGPANGTGDIMHFYNAQNEICAWIDCNGIAYGNLPSNPVAAANFANNETPSGSTPGVNFSLAHSPNPPQSLRLIWNELCLTAGIDYTLSGNALTMTQEVMNSDVLTAFYMY